MASKALRGKALGSGRRKRAFYIVTSGTGDFPEVAPRPYRDTSRRDLASHCVLNLPITVTTTTMMTMVMMLIMMMMTMTTITIMNLVTIVFVFFLFLLLFATA